MVIPAFPWAASLASASYLLPAIGAPLHHTSFALPAQAAGLAHRVGGSQDMKSHFQGVKMGQGRSKSLLEGLSCWKRWRYLVQGEEERDKGKKEGWELSV